MFGRSAGLISRRHSDKNSVEFEVFETVNLNWNNQACGDRPHPTPITESSNRKFSQKISRLFFQILRRFPGGKIIPVDFQDFQECYTPCNHHDMLILTS